MKIFASVSCLEKRIPPTNKRVVWLRRVASVISSVEWHPIPLVEWHPRTILTSRVSACIALSLFFLPNQNPICRSLVLSIVVAANVREVCWKEKGLEGAGF